MIKLAETLGKPATVRAGNKKYERLSPVENKKALPRSLSRQYGMGKFPLHTDTAHWMIPCRYVLMGCVQPGAAGRNTSLLDTRKINFTRAQKNKMLSTPFRIVNGRNSFFSSMICEERNFVRLDPGCMKAVDQSGIQIFKWFSNKNKMVERINWVTGMILIIDNWRVMHGREAVKRNDENRLLVRVLVNE